MGKIMLSLTTFGLPGFNGLLLDDQFILLPGDGGGGGGGRTHVSTFGALKALDLVVQGLHGVEAHQTGSAAAGRPIPLIVVVVLLLLLMLMLLLLLLLMQAEFVAAAGAARGRFAAAQLFQRLFLALHVQLRVFQGR